MRTNVPPPDARRARSKRALARADLLAAAGRRARRVLRRSLVQLCDGRDALPLPKDARPLPRSFIKFQRLRALRRRRRRVEERREPGRLGDVRRRRGQRPVRAALGAADRLPRTTPYHCKKPRRPRAGFNGPGRRGTAGLGRPVPRRLRRHGRDVGDASRRRGAGVRTASRRTRGKSALAVVNTARGAGTVVAAAAGLLCC